MKAFKKICMAVLFPHPAIGVLLLPIATAFLIYSLLSLESDSIVAILSYVLSAYTLTIWCLRIPALLQLLRAWKKDNRYLRRWFADVHLRMRLTLYASLLWNTAYALFQLWLGITYATFWFYSLAGYYLSLAVTRAFLASHTKKYTAGERMAEELKKYRICGWIFLLMNLVLSVMIFFMIYWDRTFEHDPTTTIAIAAYTFISLTVSIVNLVKYRKYQSPVYSASKAISLAAACVSLLTLTSTMLTTFGDSGETEFRRWMLAILGGAVSAFIIGMAIYMIKRSSKKLKEFKTDSLPINTE